MGSFTREEIEMFCLARLINCYIDTDPENNFIDWCAPPKIRRSFGLAPANWIFVGSNSWGCLEELVSYRSQKRWLW